ncbi:hypothetical protein CsatB_015900 [Cannabis sativa]
MVYEDVSQCVKLCSDNIDNVVAEGVIIEAVGFFSYHGDIISNDYARVQITQVIQGEVEIPYRRGAIRYVRDMLQHSTPITTIKEKFSGLSQYSEDDHLLLIR